MTKEETAWLAGLFEGEGCFYLNRIQKRGKRYKYLAASINMTDEDVVRKVLATYGKGTFRNKKQRKGHKPSFEWRLHGQQLVREFFAQVAPYLCSRRCLTYHALVSQLAEEADSKPAQ